MNVGTVGGVPNLLPPTWYNLMMEIKISGHINRRFVLNAFNDINALTVAYAAIVDGGGLVTINIPITVTLVSA